MEGTHLRGMHLRRIGEAEGYPLAYPPKDGLSSASKQPTSHWKSC
jgi:hypothetical protein